MTQDILYKPFYAVCHLKAVIGDALMAISSLYFGWLDNSKAQWLAFLPCVQKDVGTNPLPVIFADSVIGMVVSVLKCQ